MHGLTTEGLSKQLNGAMAHLKHFISIEKKAGFTDAAKTIELLSKELFFAAGIAEFTDANLVKGNHPAIDLFARGQGGKKGIAAQVTSTANVVKLKDTIKKFEHKDDTKGTSLLDEYGELYILGLITAKTDWPDCPAYCTVLDSDDLLKMIVGRNDIDAMYNAIHAIRKHPERSIFLIPNDNIDCLKIVLDRINRSAVKHYMLCEGSVKDMLDGLDEILEVITTGSVKGRSVAKPLSEYDDKDIRKFFNDVMELVQEIKAIVNGASNVRHIKTNDHAFCNLNQNDDMKIDSLKEKIVNAFNEISTKYLLGGKIKMLGHPKHPPSFNLQA
jgi:hypothetical protein